MVYYIFYKPYQVLSQFSREGEKKTLADFFPGISKNIYSVGRLDYDSEGLLLLTDDKALTHRLLDPSFAHERTYWVQVDGAITDEAIKKLQQGVLINVDGKQYKTKKAKAVIIAEPNVPERNPPIRFRKNIPTSWIALTLTEGKNRQVRKMTAAVGFPTLRLVRHSIGAVTIDGVEPGTYKELDRFPLCKIVRSGEGQCNNKVRRDRKWRSRGSLANNSITIQLIATAVIK